MCSHHLINCLNYACIDVPVKLTDKYASHMPLVLSHNVPLKQECFRGPPPTDPSAAMPVRFVGMGHLREESWGGGEAGVEDSEARVEVYVVILETE